MTKNEETYVRMCRRSGQLILLGASLALTAGAQDLTCPAVTPTPGNNFRGQTIVKGNFSYRDLANADFSNATLVAPYFAYANLTNANFQGAVFLSDAGNPTMVSDFSFANLQKTCFIDARFQGLAYFTNATLTCADFSKTDLSKQNVIFGDTQLAFDRARTDCRLAFRFAIMDCEFLSDWRFMDLAGADISACSGQLSGRDFSGVKLNSVDLTGANLDGAKFVKADLSQAILDQASLRGADLSYAILLGAHLNLANLTGASLYHAFLSNDTQGGISNAASVRQSHLKNVNLSYAQVSGVDFTYSNFYGDNPAGNSICKTALSANRCRESGTGNYEGFTCGCASAHGAAMKLTKFSRAYLYGVDFTAAVGQGVDFREAVLAGANLNGAGISSDPQSGAASTFFRAFLQGTTLDGAGISDRPSLADAFVDFSPHGNNIYIFLDGANHNQFACQDCSPPTGSDVCVVVNYSQPTRAPGSVAFTCPNGSVGDCGENAPNGSNPNWRSGIADLGAPPSGVPPAWYESDSTYIKAPKNPRTICKDQGPDSAILLW